MTSTEKVKILLVDDQPARLLSYEAILQDLGQELVRVTSGFEALERLMEDDFAVILLDVNMPGMDGFETAALIHQHPRFEKTPIIFVTALHVSDLDRLKGYELGAVDYVFIPVVPAILRSKVSVLVELYCKRRELEEVNRRLKLANEELASSNMSLQAEKNRELQQLNGVLEQANTKLSQINDSLTLEMNVRERAESALRKSEAELRAILQNTSAVIFQIGLDNRFVHVNRMFEKTFGELEASVVGKSIHDVFPRTTAVSVEANNKRVLEENRPIEFEETIPLNGQMHQFHTIKAPLVDDSGMLRGLVGVWTDITERKKLEDALKEADRRKDEFIAMLAHELRNPLAPILNAVQLMQIKDSLDTENKLYVSMIERQVEQLRRLVDDLMDISRITQGKFKLQHEHVKVADVVSSAVETCRPLIESRQHTISIDVTRDAVILGDRTRLEQIIGNLLNNAAKYTDHRGRISITGELIRDRAGVPREVELRITDTGVGIDPAMIPRLFALFSQIDSTLDRSSGGLGVGLALVLRLVTMHGGSVAAHSEGKGKGSTFTVRLPLAAQNAELAQTAPQKGNNNDRAVARGKRILVADDNVDSATSLAMILRKNGNEVKIAHNGVECLELAERFRPEFILLDIGMPKMNGYEAARKIREKDWGRDVVLIAVTGWGQDDVRQRVQESGFNAHLVKPIEIATLRKYMNIRETGRDGVLQTG
jgi:PAS domain S-box-containing protein